LILSTVIPIVPFVGASGAVLGVAMAFAIQNPDAELMIFPIPVPIKARTLVMIIAGLDLLGAMVGGNSGIAHVAHLGGLAFGWLFFRVQQIGRGDSAPHFPLTRPRVAGNSKPPNSIGCSTRSGPLESTPSPNLSGPFSTTSPAAVAAIRNRPLSRRADHTGAATIPPEHLTGRRMMPITVG
jgi:hypothetical protein